MSEADVIELHPQLDACIETQARREYHAALSEMMKTDEDAGLVKKLEALRMFLEKEDFNRLRAESEPYLAQGKKVTFLLRPGKDRTDYEMQVSEQS